MLLDPLYTDRWSFVSYGGEVFGLQLLFVLTLELQLQNLRKQSRNHIRVYAAHTVSSNHTPKSSYSSSNLEYRHLGFMVSHASLLMITTIVLLPPRFYGSEPPGCYQLLCSRSGSAPVNGAR